MHYLSYLYPSDAEITIEQLDKVAGTLNEKVKSFAKLFVILIGWCLFNIIIALFINRTHSLSLDSYRVISEGLRSLAMQDLLFVLTLFFDNKIGYVIALTMIFSFGVAFFVRLLNLGGDEAMEKNANKRSDYSCLMLKCEAYVVSYKLQVAFLA